jgi:hypothetical protein
MNDYHVQPKPCAKEVHEIVRGNAGFGPQRREGSVSLSHVASSPSHGL